MGTSLFRQNVSGDSVPGRIRYYYYRYWRDKPVSRGSADFVTLLTFFLVDVGGGEFHTDDRRAGNAPSFDHDGAATNLDAPEHPALVLLQGRHQVGIAGIGADEGSQFFTGVEDFVEILALD